MNWKDNELQIDPTPFEQRLARIEANRRADVAAGKIHAVAVTERVRGTWGKDALMREVARLQAPPQMTRRLRWRQYEGL